MRCRMLNLAVALSTFGLGVVAATFWLASGSPRAVELPHADSHRYAPQAVLVAEPPAPPVAPAPPVIRLVACEAEDENPEGTTVLGDSAMRPIRGGILNGKAISKPAPAYPAEARAAHVTGSVAVEVTVDECGEVFEAFAVSGPEMLRAAAVDAALAARFTPTRLSGKPVRVSGTITYNFVLQ